MTVFEFKIFFKNLIFEFTVIFGHFVKFSGHFMKCSRSPYSILRVWSFRKFEFMGLNIEYENFHIIFVPGLRERLLRQDKYWSTYVYFCTWATKDGKIVKPAVAVEYSRFLEKRK